MPYPELIKAFLAYLISHTGRPDREKRARLLARIGLERLTLADLTYEALEGSHLRWGEILKLTRRGQAKASRELFGQDQAFASSVPVGVEHRSHPPLPVLEEYLNGRLEDRPLALDRASLEGLIGGETRDWSLSEVSLHLATCRRCAARVAELRAAELELARTPDLGGARAREKERVLLRRRRAYQLLAPVGVALFLVFINLVFFRHSFLFFRPVIQPGPSPSLSEESQVVYEEGWEGFPEDFIPLGTRPSTPWPR
jgi:hypothetical protein